MLEERESQEKFNYMIQTKNMNMTQAQTNDNYLSNMWLIPFFPRE